MPSYDRKYLDSIVRLLTHLLNLKEYHYFYAEFSNFIKFEISLEAFPSSFIPFFRVMSKQQPYKTHPMLFPQFY